MKLTVVIFANGLVVSTYDNGKPADEYTGKLNMLLEIDKVTGANKFTLPKDKQLFEVNYYYSADPLCESKVKVDNKFITSYIEHLKLLAVALNTTPEKVVNQESINIDTAIKPNINFNNQDLPYQG